MLTIKMKAPQQYAKFFKKILFNLWIKNSIYGLNSIYVYMSRQFSQIYYMPIFDKYIWIEGLQWDI